MAARHVGDPVSGRVWRSPDGFQAARLSPFELAYEVFVELCRSLPEHALLPRIDFDAPLAGGGRLTVMEFMLPAEGPGVEDITARWENAADDDPVRVIRREPNGSMTRPPVPSPTGVDSTSTPATS